jgi:hypothetical protein
MYISFDDGQRWQTFQLNLPIVPITDLTIKDDDLVVATQGRAFWVLDDLTLLHQLKPELDNRDVHLFQPRPAYRLPGGGRGGEGEGPQRLPRTEGQNPPSGVVIHYFLKQAPGKDTPVSLEILTADGTLVRRFSSSAPASTPETSEEAEGGGRRRGGRQSDRLQPRAGMNRFVWNLSYPDAEDFPGMIIWGSLSGPRAIPGAYQARLRIGREELTVPFEVRPDPRSSATPADYEAQLRFLIAIRDKLTETHRAIKQIRDVRDQLSAATRRAKGHPDAAAIAAAAKSIEKELTAIEEALHQTKAKSSQDVLNYPIRLNNKLASLAGVVGAGDNRPTEQALQVKDELTAQTDAELAKLRHLLAEDLPRFNDLLDRKKVPGVAVENPAEKK